MKKTARKLSWRDYPDANLPPLRHHSSPESLHPSERTVFAAVEGNHAARAIVDSYAFRFPVTLVEVID